MDITRSLGFNLCVLATFFSIGYVAVKSELHPVTWWIFGGLGMVVFASTAAVMLFKRCLDYLKKNFDIRGSQVAQQRKELEPLYRADDVLRWHLHLDEVLQSLVKTAIGLLYADKGTLMVWKENKEKLIVRSSFCFYPGTVSRISIGPGEGLASKVALSGKPLLFSHEIIG